MAQYAAQQNSAQRNKKTHSKSHSVQRPALLA
jgi:hypothetical protein